MTATVLAGFRPRRLAHVNLFVSDLGRSLEFYTTVCGLTPVFEEPGIATVFLSNGNSHHDLALMEISEQARVGRDGNVQVSRGRGRAAGLNHLGWELASEAELVDAIRRVRATGARLHRTVDHQISHSAYLFDPDGTYLEMYADASDDWHAVYAENSGRLITGNWDPEGAPADPRERFTADPDYTVVDGAALHPLCTARACLAVADLDSALDFYHRLGGLTVLRSGPEGAVLGGTLGLPDLTLLRAGDGLEPGLSHFGLRLREEADLAAGAARAAAAGVEPVATVDAAHKKSVVLRDPDGVLVEFLVPGDPTATLPVPRPAARFAA